jgi:hypothetical protein
MYDFFWIDKIKKRKCENFINNIASKPDEYLLIGLFYLSTRREEGTGDKYTEIKLNAIENELDKRGYMNDIKHTNSFQ